MSSISLIYNEVCGLKLKMEMGITELYNKENLT